MNLGETVDDFLAGTISTSTGVIRVTSSAGIVNGGSGVVNFNAPDIRLVAANLGTAINRLVYEQPKTTGTAVTSFTTTTTGDQYLKFVSSTANRVSGIPVNNAYLTNLVSTQGVIDLDSEAPIQVVSVSSTAAGVKLKSAYSINDANSSPAPDIIGFTGIDLESVNGTIGESGAGLEVVQGPTGALKARAAGTVWLVQTANDMRVDSVISIAGTARLYSYGSIIDAFSDTGTDVTGVSIDLNSTAGGIGDSSKELDSDNGSGRFTATASGAIRLRETAGDMRVGRVQAGQEVKLSAAQGSILDGSNDAFVKISGTDITLVSDKAAIGSAADELEIDTQGTGRLTASATTDAYITEKIGALKVTSVGAGANLRLSVAESSGQGDDIILDSGSTVSGGKDVSLLAGDNITVTAGAAVTAGTVLNLTGDKPSLDPEGSIITIAGDLNASTVSITAAAGQGAKLVSSIDGNQELSNSQLKRTPASSTTVQTIAIIGFTQASLAGGASDNTMSIGGWTGSVTVDGGSGYDTITVTTDTDFNIADGLIKRVGTGDATIIGIENGVFRGGVKANKFDVSGWTKAGQINGDLSPPKQNDTIISSGSGAFLLSGTALKRAGTVDLVLGGIESAELTGGAGDDLFDVSGWAGTGKITGGLGIDTLVASNDADMLLSDIALSRTAGKTSLGSMTLAGLESAQLTGGVSANKFTLSGWSGDASIAGNGGTGDSFVLTADANYTLEASKITRTMTGKSVSMAGIANVSLSGGASANRFTVNGWTGPVSIAGGGGVDTIAYAGSGDVSVSPTVFTAGGAVVNLSAVTLVDIALGNDNSTVSVNGWTGGGTIAAGDGTDTLSVTTATAMTLSDTSVTPVTATGAKSIAISGFDTAAITGTSAIQTYTVSGWSKGGSINAGGSLPDRLVDTGSGTFILQGNTYTRPDGSVWTLTGVGPNLTGSSGNDALTISGWTGSTGASLGFSGVGGSDTISIAADANFAYTASGANGSLAIGAATLAINGTAAISSLNLTGGTGNNTFNLSGWARAATVDGKDGNDTLIYSGDTDFLLGASTLRVGKGSAVSTIGFSSVEAASLTGGASANNFNVNGFLGALSLDGGAGSDIYNLQLPDNVTLAWIVADTGRSGTDVINAKGTNSAPVVTNTTTMKRIVYMQVVVTFSGIETISSGTGNF